MSICKAKPPIPIEILKKITIYFERIEQEFPLDPSYVFSAPVAIPEHVAIFKDLQKLSSVGIVKPIGDDHLYFAAMNSKSCKLTLLGQGYWHIIKEGRI